MTFFSDLFANLILRPVIGAIRFLPEPVAMALSSAVIRALLFILPRLDTTATRNLELVFPELSPAERDEIKKRSYRVLARNIFFFARIPDISRTQILSMVDYSEGDRAVAQTAGRGALYLTLHFGCFEFSAQVYTLKHEPIFIVARDLGLPILDRWWRARREFNGSTVISRAGATKEVIRRLGEGRGVAMLFDQNVKANHAAFVSFFGITAATTKTPALAALRTGVPVVVSALVETAPHQFKLFARVIDPPADGTIEEQTVDLLERTHRVAEEYIRAFPEQ